jgi:hypothetical protein
MAKPPMPAAPQDDLGFTRSDAKATGIMALAGILVILLAGYLLPPRPAAIVGALALFVVVVTGAHCVFQSATLVSHALQGQQRRRFQVVVSLIAPALVSVSLVSRVDAVPVDTLWGILTPWLILPLAIIATVSWYASGVLDREHPFRGFVITATIFGVLCWFWTMGMTGGDTHDEEGGSGFYLDPGLAQRARETGEYVWRYLIYVSASYAVLVYRWWKPVKPSPGEAFAKLNEALTPDAVDAIVSKMNQYIIEREAGHGRKADLPVPVAALEMAYLKAILDCPDPQRLERLKVIYITLDDFLLSDEDCSALDAWDKMTSDVTEGQLSDIEIATRLSEVGGRAQEVRKKLEEAMHRRASVISTLKR